MALSRGHLIISALQAKEYNNEVRLRTWIFVSKPKSREFRPRFSPRP